jgi:curved DNA-binding protein CbpA
MFVDYYHLLGISHEASLEEIKKAFKKQALKWHPDRNSSPDAEEMMKLINEAYLLLKDKEARLKYDEEHKEFRKSQTKYKEASSENQDRSEKQTYKSNFHEYEIRDDDLKRWILNARAQAVNLAKQTIKDLKGVTGAGVSGAVEGAVSAVGSYIGLSILFSIIFALARGCS